jgi:chemotaxis protein MotB
MKSRESGYDAGNGQVASWQMVYSSLALILVVVFAMLVSYSVADKRKIEHLSRSVNREAGNLDGGKTEGENFGAVSVEGDSDGAWTKDASNLLGNSAAVAGLQDDVTLQRFGRGIKLKLKGDAVFASGSAIVSEKVYPYLDEIARIADGRDLSLRVEGHTDDIPINTEEFPSNWELSTKRAVNIVRYFIEKKGFPAGRLAAEGFGQYRPILSGTGPEERGLNRRIEIYIESEDKGVSSRERSHE